MIETSDDVGKYFKVNKILLSLIGFWPYQNPRISQIATSIILFMTISQLIPQIAGLLKVRGDIDTVIESLPPLGVEGICTIKLINLITNKDKLKDLLIEIQRDFKKSIPDCKSEIEIVKQYGKRSIESAKIYAPAMYTVAILFVLLPIIEALSSTKVNEIESYKRLPYIVEYYVDTGKYFYFIIIHSFLSTIAFCTISIAADTIFTVYIHQGCAKFMILKYRLSQVVKFDKYHVELNPREIDDLVYHRVKICVDLHKEAIEFANAIESAHTVSQLFQVGLCCLVMSITGLHAITKLSKPNELVRFFGIIIATMLHVLFYSWQSHELMDQSVSVCGAIYDTEWYGVSIRTRKLLLQMMTRSLVTCKITAGKLYLMSMQNYSKVLSNSMSYFTMLSSIQEGSTLTE